MKRQLKRQLKGDEFVSGMNKFMHYLKVWERELVIAGAALLVIVLIFFGFQFLRAQQNSKTSAEAARILDLRTDLAKNPANVAKLEQAATQGGKYGRVASVALATYWVEQGQLEKGQAALAGIKDGSRDFFYYQAQDLSAQIATLKGEYDKALAILKKIEDAKPKDYLPDAVLFHKAEALEKKGSAAEAMAVYKKLQDEYAQSYYGYDASLKVKKMEPAKVARRLDKSSEKAIMSL